MRKDEKDTLLSLIENGQFQWIEEYYSTRKKDISRIETDVYSLVPEAAWGRGYIHCLWFYITALENISAAQLRGASNDNSWFLDYYRPLYRPIRMLRPMPRLPVLKFHPFKKISRFRQWSNEAEFRALISPPKSSSSKKTAEIDTQ